MHLNYLGSIEDVFWFSPEVWRPLPGKRHSALQCSVSIYRKSPGSLIGRSIFLRVLCDAMYYSYLSLGALQNAL